MFPLYDHTRRQICTAAFLGLCVLPTLVVTGWSIARHLPWHKQAEEERLGQELGLAVSIESMEHALPGVMRYRGLKLTDPETGQELFRCSELAATWTSMTDSHGQTRPAIVLAAAQAESATSAWQRLDEVLRRRLECQGGRPEIEIRLTADSWTLHDDQSQVLQAVEGGVGLMPNGIQAQLAFQLPGANSPQPVRIRIVRNRQVSPPANGFEMDTGPCPVPCRLLAACLNDVTALGPNCRFAGHVSTYSTPGGWSGELSGQLTGVDLGRMAQANTAAALTGTADITLQKASFQRGRIDEITGRIVCGPGALGRDMLAALVTHLHFAPSQQRPVAVADTDRSLAFDQLGLDFWIDNRGISIAGLCANMSGTEKPRAVAVAGGQVVLTEPASQPQPVAGLIQALVATRQTGWLARLLPISDAGRAN